MTTPISLTELRQRLFQLADHVVDSGESLLIERRGVRLRLIREEAELPREGRLARLVKQEAVIGAPLAPDETPALWGGGALPQVAESAVPWPKAGKGRRGRT
jgi:hypothetical protein